MVFWAIRRGNSLIPDMSDSASEMAKLPFGKRLHVEVKQPRNPGRHRLFFALCHRIADAIDVNAEALRDHLTVKAGHYYEVKTRDGMCRYPKSIAWSKMDETAFKEFFDRCVRIIYDDFGIARPDILDAVGDLLEPKEEAHNATR